MKFALFYLTRTNADKDPFLRPFPTGDAKQPTLWVRMEIVDVPSDGDTDEFATALDLAHEHQKADETVMNCHPLVPVTEDPWGPGGKFVQAEEGISEG